MNIILLFCPCLKAASGGSLRAHIDRRHDNQPQSAGTTQRCGQHLQGF